MLVCISCMSVCVRACTHGGRGEHGKHGSFQSSSLLGPLPVFLSVWGPFPPLLLCLKGGVAAPQRAVSFQVPPAPNWSFTASGTDPGGSQHHFPGECCFHSSLTYPVCSWREFDNKPPSSHSPQPRPLNTFK